MVKLCRYGNPGQRHDSVTVPRLRRLHERTRLQPHAGRSRFHHSGEAFRAAEAVASTLHITTLTSLKDVDRFVVFLTVKNTQHLRLVNNGFRGSARSRRDLCVEVQFQSRGSELLEMAGTPMMTEAKR